MRSDHSPRAGTRSNRIAAIVLLLFSLAYGIGGSAVEYSFSSDPLGPRVFPVLLASILGLLSLIYLLVPGQAEEWPKGTILARCIGLPILVMVAALILEPLGFAVSMFVLTVGVGRLFGASWKASIIGGILQAALWYFIFGYLLEVYLPAGELISASRRG